ncbi:MAG: nicotinate (nicotinamide) nucleotide adenylyltransferase [Oscillospiraceae bacterium]|nr:nicotinate (nicotinamide) nucleotide adenylyltransferase [Oscillospiraceae bacterium]
MKRTGIYGGSFDPVHKGHIHLAKTAMKYFDIDEVIFVPAKVSPFKQSKTDVTEGKHRLAMLRLALENEPSMSVSDYELLQENVSYTIYTVRHMKELYKEDTLVLLMGSDMFLSFQKWYCWQEIMSLAEIGCISRNSGDRDMLLKQAGILSEFGKANVCCDDILPVSSTEIRKFLKKGEECSCYLPENVVQYIVKHNLYGV